LALIVCKTLVLQLKSIKQGELQQLALCLRLLAYLDEMLVPLALQAGPREEVKVKLHLQFFVLRAFPSAWFWFLVLLTIMFRFMLKFIPLIFL